MFIKEIAQVLDQLEIDPEKFGVHRKVMPEGIVELYQSVRDSCVDEASSRDIISYLEKAQKTDQYEKSPFYFMLLAYVYHVLSDWSLAENYAVRAEYQFGNQGNKLYQAMSNWLLGLLYCANADLDIAQTRIEKAIQIMQTIKNAYIGLGIFDYRDKYEEMIKIILKNYSELKNQVLEQESTKVFSDIISQLRVPDNDPIIQGWWEAICVMEPSNLSIIDINSHIGVLRDNLTLDVSPTTLFYLIFLAHCYNLGFYTEGAKYTQRDALDVATIEFKFTDYLGGMNEYNQSLVYWYIGLLYHYNNERENCLVNLNMADRLFIKLQNLYEAERATESYAEIQDLRGSLKDWTRLVTSNIPINYVSRPEDQQVHRQQSNQKAGWFGQPNPKKPSAHSGISGRPKSDQPSNSSSAPGETPLKRRQSTVSSVGSLQNVTKKGNHPPYPPSPPPPTAAPSTNGSPLLYVSIPVDTQALKNLNQETALLNASLFEQLKDFNAHMANRPPSKESVTLKDTERTVNPSNHSPVIPRFLIYGQVRAGPRGEVYLDHFCTNTKADAVDESLFVTFEKREYKVSPLNDCFPTFVEGRQYGWLKVKGESMNNAINKPIGNGDYILFHKNQDPDFCAQKIVVALLPETEEQPPHLVVKRLMKLIGEMPEGRGGYKTVIKFILRSESLFDTDPETGDDYNREINIFGEHQLAGEVIAIAKPVT